MHGKNRVPAHFPKPLNEQSLVNLLPMWHCEFLNQACQTPSDLFSLLNCATYLQAEALATVLSVKIALKMQRCDGLPELRTFLGVADDFEPSQTRLMEKGKLSLWNDICDIYEPNVNEHSEIGFASAPSNLGPGSEKVLNKLEVQQSLSVPKHIEPATFQVQVGVRELKKSSIGTEGDAYFSADQKNTYAQVRRLRVDSLP